MVRIAAMEVAPESERDLAVAGVVGRIQHKFAQRLEVALDAIEVTGRCRCCDQLDLVTGRPGTS